MCQRSLAAIHLRSNMIRSDTCIDIHAISDRSESASLIQDLSDEDFGTGIVQVLDRRLFLTKVCTGECTFAALGIAGHIPERNMFVPPESYHYRG